VTVTAANNGGTGWSATAVHSATTRTCAIFIGVAAVSRAPVDPEPMCNYPLQWRGVVTGGAHVATALRSSGTG
jgi:hypothetical protein